ncbi:hypothetical protein J6590_081704 [Homalodisca vitripennis]|nr:hypothetical protein J6590_081704 [Homalodisca vitripennis]
MLDRRVSFDDNDHDPDFEVKPNDETMSDAEYDYDMPPISLGFNVLTSNTRYCHPPMVRASGAWGKQAFLLFALAPPNPLLVYKQDLQCKEENEPPATPQSCVTSKIETAHTVNFEAAYWAGYIKSKSNGDTGCLFVDFLTFRRSSPDVQFETGCRMSHILSVAEHQSI